MRTRALAILILLGSIGTVAADIPCTAEQKYCPKILQKMADAYPDGQFDARQNAYSWLTPSGGIISVQFDWSSARGLVVTHSESRQTRRTTDEIFEVASDLASTYWAPAGSAVLVNGLAKEQYFSWMENDVIHYAICRKGACKDFFIENTYVKGIDRVSVMWTLGVSPSVEEALGFSALRR